MAIKLVTGSVRRASTFAVASTYTIFARKRPDAQITSGAWYSIGSGATVSHQLQFDTTALTVSAGAGSSSSTPILTATLGTWYDTALVDNGSSVTGYMQETRNPAAMLSQNDGAYLALPVNPVIYLASDEFGEFFSGATTDFMLWTVALTAAEINQQRRSKVPCVRLDKLYCYVPGDSAETVIQDVQGNARHFALISGTMSTDPALPPIAPSGAIGVFQNQLGAAPPTVLFDDFNRADVGTLAGNWTTGGGTEGAMAIVGNAATTSNINADCGSNYTAITLPNDQYSKAKLYVTGVSGPGDWGPGLKVRGSTAARTQYRLSCNHAATNNITLAKFIAEAYTVLTGWPVTLAWTDGDTWELRVIGTTLRVFRNGVQVGSDVTDASITAGSPGITYSSLASTASIDDWEGGAALPVTLLNAGTPVFGTTSPTGDAFSVTNSGTNRCAFACIAYDKAAGMSVTGVTYGGLAMIPCGPASVNPSPAFDYAQVWYLVNPPTGSNTLAITVAGTVQDIYRNLVVFQNVHQTTPVRPGTYFNHTNAQVFDGASHYSLVVSSNTNDLTLTCLNGGGLSITGSNQTSDGLSNAGGESFGSDHATISGASVTHTWTAGAPSGNLAIVGFSITSASANLTTTNTKQVTISAVAVASQLRVQLKQGATVIAIRDLPLTTNFETYQLDLTTAERNAISNWADLRLAFTGTTAGNTLVSQAFVRAPAGGTTVTKTVTVSAVAQKTFTKAVTIAAVAQKTITKTVTLSAVARATLTKTVTVTAVAQKTLTKTVTVSAVAWKTFTKTVTVTAVAQKTLTKSVTVSAYLIKIGTKTVTVSAVALKAGILKTVTVSAVAYKTITKTVTVSAVARATVTKLVTFTAVAWKTVIKTVTVDARILKTFTKTVTLTAVARNTLTKVVTVTAVARGTLTKLVTISAFTIGTGSKLVTFTAIARKTFTKAVTASAFAVVRSTKAVTISAVARQSITKTVTITAVALKTGTKLVTVSAVARQTFTKAVTFSAVSRQTVTKTSTFTAIATKPVTKLVTFTAVALATLTKTVTVTAVVRKSGLTKTVTANANASKTFTKTVTFTAVVVVPVLKTVTVSAVARKTLTKAVTVTANALKPGLTKTVTVNANASKTFTKAVTFNAVIVVPVLKTVTVSAVGRKTLTKAVTVSAVAKAFGVTRLVTFTAVALKQGLLKTVTANALVYKTFTKTVTFDARLYKTLVKLVTVTVVAKKLGVIRTVTVSGFASSSQSKLVTYTAVVLRTGITKSITVSAVVRGTFTKPVTVAAVARKTFTKVVTASAVAVRQAITKAVTVSAVLVKTFTKSVTLTAVIRKTFTKPVTVTAVGRKTLTKTVSVTAVASTLIFVQHFTGPVTFTALVFKPIVGVWGVADNTAFDPFLTVDGTLTPAVTVDGTLSSALQADGTLLETDG